MQLQELVIPLKLDKKGFDLSLDGITKGLMNLGTIAAGAAVAGIGALTLTIKKTVDATMDWAMEMDSIQDVMGVTNKDAAALNFVLRKAGVETSKLTSGMTILEKGLVKADGTLDDAGKKLEEFGINALDVNGNVREQGELLRDIANKYGKFSTQQERVNFLTEIFGRSGAELIDVFDTLAAEGGIDKVSEKVEKLGLAIDPAKYEAFQRNLEEIKLGFLGVGVTIVENLMPAFERFSKWWSEEGIKKFEELVTWLKTNIPIAVDNSKKAWDGMVTTWETHVSPVAEELIQLYENLNTILEKLSPSTDELAGKFTFLGVAQRVAVGWAMAVNIVLYALGDALKFANKIIESYINNWGRFTSGVRAAISALHTLINIASNPILGALGLIANTVNPKAAGKPNRRATGGAVLSGQTYKVNEIRGEMFTPNQNGRIDEAKPITVEIDENRLGIVVGRAVGEQLAKRGI